jgi:SAM-dependent methyltransferase
MRPTIGVSLNSTATYEGFDIDAVSIDWAVRNLAPGHPNFHFHLADIFSTNYNPQGRKTASEYGFPYKSESFDVVFAKSVLTHLLPAEIENYIVESERVLRPGGRCWLTFFLLNAESLALMEAGKSTLDLKFVRDRHRLLSEEIPEAAVAIDEALVESCIERAGLEITRPHRYGSWCGRTSTAGYQDAIVATK